MDVPRWPLQPTRPSREEQMDRQVDRQRARHWIGSTDYVSSGAKTPENFSVDTGSPANLTTDSPFPVAWPLEDQTLSKIKRVQDSLYKCVPNFKDISSLMKPWMQKMMIFLAVEWVKVIQLQWNSNLMSGQLKKIQYKHKKLPKYETILIYIEKTKESYLCTKFEGFILIYETINNYFDLWGHKFIKWIWLTFGCKLLKMTRLWSNWNLIYHVINQMCTQSFKLVSQNFEKSPENTDRGTNVTLE